MHKTIASNATKYPKSYDDPFSRAYDSLTRATSTNRPLYVHSIPVVPSELKNERWTNSTIVTARHKQIDQTIFTLRQFDRTPIVFSGSMRSCHGDLSAVSYASNLNAKHSDPTEYPHKYVSTGLICPRYCSRSFSSSVCSIFTYSSVSRWMCSPRLASQVWLESGRQSGRLETVWCRSSIVTSAWIA